MSQSVFQNIERVLGRIEEIKRRFGVDKRSQDTRFSEALKDEVTSNKGTSESENKADSAVGTPSVDRSHDEIINAASERFSVPQALIKAVIEQESGFREDAVSRKGAQGLMQLMPDTASLLGVEDPFDAEQNIWGGTSYLRGLLDLYEGNLNKALAAYNAGPNRVSDSIPDIPETADYVRSVIKRYGEFIKSKDSGGL
ncbi:MAG: lytic transglycosylase domain-containing protein [Spirochaetes bacterium]|nr:lytic transglycosylase domain-containing protein [Spirochaetota bacterium]